MARQYESKSTCSILLLLVCVAIVVPLADVVCQEPDSTADKPLRTSTREPILTDQAPQELKKLIIDGNVEVAYESDPEFVKAGRGWADFNVKLRYTFKHDLSKSQKNGRWHVKLAISKLKPKIELTHLIRLPVTFKSLVDVTQTIGRYWLEIVELPPENVAA